MAKDFWIVKDEYGSLQPATDEDREVLKKIEPGEAFKANPVKKRNLAFHRKFFKLIDVAFENLDEDFAVRKMVEKPNGEVYEHIEKIDTKSKLRWHIMIQAGFYETKITMGGKLIYQVKSISFDNMDDIEFNEIYEGAKDVIWKFFLPMDAQQRREFELRLLNF